MNTRYRKKKEAIRDQILKKVRYYRNSRGICFFDEPSVNFNNKSIKIDDNDVEVLLITLKRSKKILVTTKYLYIIEKSNITKIDGRDIDRFDYMVFINAEKILPNASKLRRFYIRQKINFRVGNYRIVKKNGSYIEVNFKRTRFPDCLNGCIKKLKFAARKYEGY